MKRIVSISLGSSSRDHKVITKILDEEFEISRIGTDGDIKLAIKLIKELDGYVDAFGMGGIDLYIVAGENRYILRDAKKIAHAARKTPIVDGSGLKNTLERRTIKYLNDGGIIDLKNKKVLMVCAVDRFGMAESLENSGAQITYGDLIFGLNINLPIKSLRSLQRIAKIIGPIISQMPFKLLYPTGDKQKEIKTGLEDYYYRNEIIAGDFLYIKKYLPLNNMEGKIIITNTVTKDDVALLQQRGVDKLITTTPEFDGRSFGTNVMEAVLVSMLDKIDIDNPDNIYDELLEKVGFVPRIIDFKQSNTA